MSHLFRHFLSSISTFLLLVALPVSFVSCGGSQEDDPKPVEDFRINSLQIDGTVKATNTYVDVSTTSAILVRFSAPVDQSTVASSIEFKTENGVKVPANYTYEDDGRTLSINLNSPLTMYSAYKLNIWPTIKSKQGTVISSGTSISITTGLDNLDKFPRISDDELLTLVQKQTFKYFWDFGHPTSGMARDRNSSGNVVTTGGTGFGVMAMVVASERGFVSRPDAAARVQKIVTFLATKCTSYHGAFAHWVNGETGATQPFSDKDDGADLVETSLLFQGLLTARQYFDRPTAEETRLRTDINQLWEAIDWNFYRKDNGNVLYWHWSTTYGWDMNMPITGWNECLITYVLAASSPTHSIPKEVYTRGWVGNSMINGNSYYGYQLPLGSDSNPLFFAHYSFLGLNPNGLKDSYADYWTQNKNQALINYSYCVANPKSYAGYSKDCWGLTASDGNNGYSAHSPGNDRGVIAPTAALASIPYTPEQSMAALHFFYYKLGDLLWKEYGFVDAFNLSAGWQDKESLAIDQGPIVIMIENHRTGLLWKLFMSCPEVQDGLTKLGFQYTTK